MHASTHAGCLWDSISTIHLQAIHCTTNEYQLTNIVKRLYARVNPCISPPASCSLYPEKISDKNKKNIYLWSSFHV